MHLVRPRWVVMYLLRKRTDYSLQNIGFFLGDRDHCTIWHGVRKVAAALEDSGCDLAIEIRQIEWDLEVQEAVA
jgi:chromosomal replication initiator protein